MRQSGFVRFNFLHEDVGACILEQETFSYHFIWDRSLKNCPSRFEEEIREIGIEMIFEEDIKELLPKYQPGDIVEVLAKLTIRWFDDPGGDVDSDYEVEDLKHCKVHDDYKNEFLKDEDPRMMQRLCRR